MFSTYIIIIHLPFSRRVGTVCAALIFSLYTNIKNDSYYVAMETFHDFNQNQKVLEATRMYEQNLKRTRQICQSELDLRMIALTRKFRQTKMPTMSYESE